MEEFNSASVYKKGSNEDVVESILNDTMLNPFEMFSVPPEASDAEIKKAYLNLSRKVHPDKNKHTKAADAFHLIDNAYKMLQEPE